MLRPRLAVLAAALVTALTIASAGVPAQASTVALPLAVTPGSSGSVTAQDQVFFDETFEVTVDAGLQLAGSQDGQAPWSVDDEIEMTFTRPDGSTTVYRRNFEFQPPAEPVDLTPYALPGRNTVRVVLRDTFGVYFGSTALWLRSGDPAPTPDLTYLALGDSFASGEGAEEAEFGGTTFPDPKVPGSTTGCHRSTTSWAHDVADALMDTTVRSWNFAACSGAVVDNLYGPNARYAAFTGAAEPAQMDFVDRRTYRATLSIGGNDANFADVLRACVQYPRNDGGGPNCRKKDAKGRRLADEGMARLRNGIPVPSLGRGTVKPLAQVYFDVANGMAPAGRLVVAGYPRLFATSRAGYNGGLRCKVGTGAGVIPVHMLYADAQWLNGLADEINGYIRAAVADANRTLEQARSTVVIDYADTNAQFTDHRLCSGDRWFNGVELTFPKPPARPQPKQVSLHPNAHGQDAYARAVLPRVMIGVPSSG